MVLVDTSVLIDYFRDSRNEPARKFDGLLSGGVPFGICSVIYQELLQSVASAQEFSILKRYLDSQTFYEVKRGRESYAEAAQIYRRCRRAGVTVRSTIDCLIGQIAIENNLLLLHNDQDFTRIAKVIHGLRFF